LIVGGPPPFIDESSSSYPPGTLITGIEGGAFCFCFGEDVDTEMDGMPTPLPSSGSSSKFAPPGSEICGTTNVERSSSGVLIMGIDGADEDLEGLGEGERRSGRGAGGASSRFKSITLLRFRLGVCNGCAPPRESGLAGEAGCWSGDRGFASCLACETGDIGDIGSGSATTFPKLILDINSSVSERLRCPCCTAGSDHDGWRSERVGCGCTTDGARRSKGLGLLGDRTGDGG
jgi:hypothetical protein